MAAKPDQDAEGVGGHGPMTRSPFCRADRPQKRASLTFGIRRGDCGLGDGVPARSHVRAIARTVGGTLWRLGL
jgi:hypothetical protein